MWRRRLVIIALLSAAGIAMFLPAMVSWCSYSRDYAHRIDVGSLVPYDKRTPVLAGPLLDDVDFLDTVNNSALLEFWDAPTLLRIRDGVLVKEPLPTKLPEEPRRMFAAMGGHNRFFIVQLLEHQGVALQMFTGSDPVPKILFLNPPGDDEHEPLVIDSMSLSHSGNLLAFLASTQRDREDQRLIIYDLQADKWKEIWSGDAPEQMLPWSPDDKTVVLSTYSGCVESIEVATGKQTKLTRGGDPIGFVSERKLLLLEVDNPLFRRRKFGLVEYDMAKGTSKGILHIDGPINRDRLLISPDRKYVSLWVKIYPDGRYRKGIWWYTVFVRLSDLKYALVSAHVIAWYALPDKAEPAAATLAPRALHV